MDLSWVLYLSLVARQDCKITVYKMKTRDIQSVLRATTFANDLWRPLHVTHRDGLKKLDSKLSPGAWRRDPSQRKLHKYTSVSGAFSSPSGSPPLCCLVHQHDQTPHTKAQDFSWYQVRTCRALLSLLALSIQSESQCICNASLGNMEPVSDL